MRFQFLLLSTLSCLLLSFAHADEGESTCFDLSQPTTLLLKPPPIKFSAEKDESRFGTDSKTNHDWGEVSGVIKKPLLTIVDKIVDPKTIRDDENTFVSVTDLKFPGFLKRVQEKIKIRVGPFRMITIEWTEDWGISVKEGTLKKPTSVVVAYQKTEGTSHIKHFCGNMFLLALKDDSTGIYLYEEVQASQRSAEDVMKGLLGTLGTLRK